ncbi:MAG: SPASM domain-containing protein [Finegoldia magna]|nr:SPASM domain-containing protein [Finegoldia magna]
MPFFNKFCCGLGMGEIAINFNGDVFPCKILESEEFKIGNIHGQTLQSILNSDKLKK